MTLLRRFSYHTRYGLAAGLVNTVVLAAALASSATAADEVRILALGDSLTAGYGLHLADAFPAQLQRALGADGFAARVINAGVSGDTSAGGLARLAWALGDHPHAAIVALGANDGLRGLDPGTTFANLDSLLAMLRDAGVAVVLAGMKAPPNLGRDYGAAFDAVYPRLAEKHGVPLYPFFLEGVAAEQDLNQEDGIHPNPRGVARIVRGILPYVKKLIAPGG